MSANTNAPPQAQRLADAFVAGADGYRLQAPLLFASVPQLRDQGLALLDAANGELRVDLSGVSSADSAGLALLIDWLACAGQAGKRLTYLGAPAALLALARLSDVAPLLNAPGADAPVPDVSGADMPAAALRMGS